MYQIMDDPCFMPHISVTAWLRKVTDLCSFVSLSKKYPQYGCLFDRILIKKIEISLQK